MSVKPLPTHGGQYFTCDACQATAAISSPTATTPANWTLLVGFAGPNTIMHACSQDCSNKLKSLHKR